MIPRIKELPVPTNRIDTKSKCRTCAYHNPSTEDDDFMTKCYWSEHPVPHPCHERRNGMACRGAVDAFKRLDLPIDHSLLGVE